MGHIELSNSDPATYSAKKNPGNHLPDPLYPDEEHPDVPMIAPWYASIPDNLNKLQGSIFWRRLDPNEGDSTRQSITRGMLNHLSKLIQKSFLDLPEFEATAGLVVTWFKVTYDGCFTTCPVSPFCSLIQVVYLRHSLQYCTSDQNDHMSCYWHEVVCPAFNLRSIFFVITLCMFVPV